MEDASLNSRPGPKNENRELAITYFNISAVGLEILYEASLANQEALRELRDLADRLVRRVGDWGQRAGSRMGAQEEERMSR